MPASCGSPRRRCCDRVGKFLVALLLIRDLSLGAKHLFIAAKLLEVCDRTGAGQTPSQGLLKDEATLERLIGLRLAEEAGAG